MDQEYLLQLLRSAQNNNQACMPIKKQQELAKPKQNYGLLIFLVVIMVVVTIVVIIYVYKYLYKPKPTFNKQFINPVLPSILKQSSPPQVRHIPIHSLEEEIPMVININITRDAIEKIVEKCPEPPTILKQFTSEQEEETKPTKEEKIEALVKTEENKNNETTPETKQETVEGNILDQLTD